MNRREVRDTLAAAGVADGSYRIEGVHEPVPTPVDFLFLRQGRDGGWETGVYERGSHQVIARHSTEAGACTHLVSLAM
ncbi:hypothetical protein [Streptomyces sp. NBC_00690]|uniref:hypothetical protein n=1 Tax=Streptomyces sp. NBC_00690 TaxID=2975808 RepID=UPI002E2C72C9|nr:hypothetical protein [Streptomyces sp. NBC_00690]